MRLALAASALLLAAGCSTGPHYRDCGQARQEGATPIHRGDPGYSTDLDRDGDGIACDP